MFVPVRQTSLLQRYFTIAAIAVIPIVIAGFVPLYTLRLLHHDPLLTVRVQAHGLVIASSGGGGRRPGRLRGGPMSTTARQSAVVAREPGRRVGDAPIEARDREQ